MSDTDFSSWTKTNFEEYITAKKLDNDSAKDPPTEPYKSKYFARGILNRLLISLEEIKTSDPALRDNCQAKQIFLLLLFEIGKIDIKTEERDSGGRFLERCYNEGNFENISSQPDSCLLAISLANQLGILYCNRGNACEALKVLHIAEKTFERARKNSEAPWSFEDIWISNSGKLKTWDDFDMEYIHTLYLMAQIYEQLKEDVKSATLCARSLKKRLELKDHLKDFNVLTWLHFCTRLADYSIRESLFVSARHLLCCSEYVLCNHEESLNQLTKESIQNGGTKEKAETDKVEENEDETQGEEDQQLKLSELKAKISIAWTKYAITLLDIEENEDISDAVQEENRREYSNIRLVENEQLSKLEDGVPETISCYDDARRTFLLGQKHVQKAKDYYTLNEFASFYTRIVQDHCQLYHHLADHDSDLGRRCKMHRRRITMMEDLLKQLNPQFYLILCQELMIQLANTYHDLIKCKVAIDCSSKKAVDKISRLAEKCIDSFQKLIDTFRDSKTKKLPDAYSDDLVVTALSAHIGISLVHYKMIDVFPERFLSNSSKVEAYLRYIEEYCDRNNETQGHLITRERLATQELLQILPLKKLTLASKDEFHTKRTQF